MTNESQAEDQLVTDESDCNGMELDENYSFYGQFLIQV
jgi:hypothetical protein